VLRIVHIQRNPESGPNDPRYDILDAGRYGSESGVAEISHSLTPQRVGDWLAAQGVSYSAIAKSLNQLSEMGSTQVELAPRIGPRIVRAWFDTVFNPLVPSLEFELGLLSRRNWTFSFAPRVLDLIRPVRSYLRPEAEANLDQILQLNVALAANAHEHDTGVQRLFDFAIALHTALAANRDFIDLCTSLMGRGRLLELGIDDSREIFGAYPESDRFKLLAQNVINNTGDLPSHYSTARFWNAHRQELLQSLDLPNIREGYNSILQVGEHLAAVSNTLLNQLKAIRLELSLRHDVPYVDSGRAQLTA
jgi:hypothetical protein